MAETPTPRPSAGRALAEAARQVGKLHRAALADCGTDFPTFMLLTLLHEQPSAIPADDVVSELDRRMDLPRTDALALLDRAAASDLVPRHLDSAITTVELTSFGREFLAKLYAHSRSVTDAAFDGIAPDTLDAAVTVLLTIDARATALLDA